MTTGEFLESLSPHTDDTNSPPSPETPQHDWLAPLPTVEGIRRKCHTDVSQNPIYNYWGLSATEGDAECTTAPRRIPDWVLPQVETQPLFQTGHGTAPDIIYARVLPDSPSPDPTSFDRKHSTLVIVNIDFCMDFRCEIKIEKKTEKYSPLVAVFREYYGRVEVIAFPIGRAGTTLTKTLDHLTAAFSTVRPSVERSQASRGAASPATDHNARIHD